MSVTPGSDTLWSVHSGQRCWTIRLASSTRSWNRRSSRLGAGSGTSLLPQCGGWLMIHLRRLALGGNDVERKHQVARIVAPSDRIGDVDVERRPVAGVRHDVDPEHIDPRFPPLQRLLYLERKVAGGRGVGGGKDEVVDAAAEFRPHGALPIGRAEDEPDRLLDFPLLRDQRDPPRGLDPEGEGPSRADEILAQLSLLSERSPQCR